MKKILNVFLVTLLLFTNIVSIKAENESPAQENEETVEVSSQEQSEITLEEHVSASNEQDILEDNTDLSLADTLDLDFNSKRLLIASDYELNDEHVISSYDGLYLLQYESIDEAKQAYLFYLDKVEFVEPDVEVVATDDETPAIDSNEEEVLTEQENAFVELEKELDKQEVFEEIEDKKQIVVALLDSGTNEHESIIGRVSMLGDLLDDDNGHGNKMLDTILSINKEAKVLSIKVLDENGKGNISSVIAGLEYAIEQGVDIINMSLNARNTLENSVLKEYVLKAVEKGIKVVVSAGNNNKDAKWYTPSNILEAIVVGSCDENKEKLASSNYGDTVDYYVLSSSSSIATAKMSGWYSLNNENPSERFLALDNEKVQESLPLDNDTDKFVGNDLPSNHKYYDDLTDEQKFNENLINLTRIDAEQDRQLVYENTGSYLATKNIKDNSFLEDEIKNKMMAADSGQETYFNNEYLNKYVKESQELVLIDEYKGPIELKYENVGRYQNDMVDVVVVYDDFVLFNSDERVPDNPWSRAFGNANQTLHHTGAPFITYAEQFAPSGKMSGFWAVGIKQMSVSYTFYKHGSNTPLTISNSSIVWEQLERGEKVAYDNNPNANIYVFHADTNNIVGAWDNSTFIRSSYINAGGRDIIAYDSYLENGNTESTSTATNRVIDSAVDIYSPTISGNGNLSIPAQNIVFKLNNAQTHKFWFNWAQDSNIDENHYSSSFQAPQFIDSIDPPITFNITTEVEHGSITPSRYNLPSNNTYYVESNAENGYILKSITVDGVNIPITQVGLNDNNLGLVYEDTDNYYVKLQFPNLRANHHVKVVYEPKTSSFQNTPKKYILDGNNLVTSNKLRKGDTFTYELQYEMPTGKLSGGENPYSFLSFNDPLPKSVSLVSVKLLGGGNGELASWTPSSAELNQDVATKESDFGTFWRVKNNNGVGFDFKSDWLNWNEIYDGTVYKLRVTVKVNDNAENKFTNRFSMFIDNNQKLSNQVTTTLRYNLTINYLEKGTEKVLATKYGPTAFDAGYKYNVTSPTVKDYVLVNSAQAKVAGTLTKDTVVNVYYQKDIHKLTIKYINKVTNEKVANDYTEDLVTGTNYSVKSPSKDDLYLENNSQATVSGTMPNKDVTVTVYYLPYHKITTKATNGTITTTKDGTLGAQGTLTKYKNTDSQVIKYKANPNHLISTITVNDVKQKVSASNAKQWSFDPTDRDNDIKVVFEPQPAPVKSVKDEAGNNAHNKIVKTGEKLTYSIKVENKTDLPLTYTLTDKVPTDASFVSASDNGKLNNGTVTWTLDLAKNSSKTVTMICEVNKQATVYRNKAELSVQDLAGNKVILPSNEVVTTTPEPSKKDAYDGDVIANGKMHKVGDTYDYVISTSNPAPTSKNFKITDTLSEGLELVSMNPEGSYDASTRTITWNKQLSSKEEFKASITVKILEVAEGSIIENQAFVGVDNIIDPTPIPEIPVMPNPEKDVFLEDVSVNGEYVPVGEPLRFTIKTKNVAKEAKEFIIKDKLDPRLEDVKDISLDGKFENGVITWSKELQPQEELEVEFYATINQKGQIVENIATVIVDDSEIDTNIVKIYTPDDILKDITDEKGISINGEYQLAGTTIIYPITVNNIADVNKIFEIEDELDKNLEIIELSDDGQLDENNVARWSLKLEAFERKTVYVKAIIKQEAKDSIIPNDALQIVDKSKVNVIDIPEIPVLFEPTKKVMDSNGNDINKQNVSRGSKLIYELSVHNCFKEEKEFTFVDDIASGLQLIRVNNNGKAEDGVITWKKVLKPNETWSVSYEVKTIQFGVYLPNEADLYVDKISSKTNLVENWVPTEPIKEVVDEKGNDANYQWIVAQDERQLTYNIHFNNPSDKKVDVTITDTLDRPVLYVYASHNGVYDEQTRTITWNLKDVPAYSDDYFVSVDVRFLGEYAQTKINNKARVKFDKFDHETNIVTNYLVDDPTTIDLKGEKTWDDDNNKQGLRPKYIVVELLANGEPYRSAKVQPNKDGEWKYSFSYLPKYMKGKEVEYSVDEYPIDNYVAKVKGMDITNKAIPAPVKYVKQDGKDINLKEVGIGEVFDYEIKVFNIFEEDKEVKINDTLPYGLEVVSVSDKGQVDLANNVSWLITVKGESEYTVKVKVKVLGKALDTLVNQAEVIIEDNKQPTNEVINPVVKLIEPKKSVHDFKGVDINGKAVNEGDVIEYRVEVKNPYSQEKQVSVFDKLPKGLEFVSADNNGKFNNKTNKVSWSFKLDGKESKTVSFKVKVIKSEQGLFENTAELKIGEDTIFSNTVRNTKCCTVPCDPIKPVNTSIK